ncbi:MAG TPA: hypothetical protein VK455_00055 [Thermoplasmata archaeon]|nr:hypothetical protein [Thermoplasmata archaeon]
MATSTISKGKRTVFSASIAVALIMLLGGAVSASHLTSKAAPAGQAATATPALGTPEQWAFGGSVSVSYSCSQDKCLGEVLNNTTFSFSLHYFIEWVVIYTETNISGTQSQIEGQTALNISASYAFSECTNATVGPCTNNISYAITLGGKETSTGFTNITNGTVNLTVGPGSPVALDPALAVMNAASNAAFNFSGSYSFQNATIGKETASFDFGASETSSVTFGSPLGIVPLDPQPTNAWNDNQTYTASGSATSGYSITATELGIPVTESKWNTTSVTPSGRLFVNGSDLGAYTLHDNYTHPPTNTTAQLISLEFSNGNFSGSDGWILLPTELYGGLLGLDAARSIGGIAPALAIQPSSGLTVSSGETAYYHEGSGFVAANEADNSSIPGGVGSAGVNLTAGPEPLSVAQGQLAAITASPAGAGSLPLMLILVVVVVAVVVVAAGALVWKRSARRGRPPTTVPTPGGPISQPPTGPGSG